MGIGVGELDKIVAEARGDGKSGEASSALKMALEIMGNTDHDPIDPIASWRDRIGTLRKRGRIGAAALSIVPAEEIDVRAGRPAPPERLSDGERALRERLTLSRHPGWFAGAEELLET